MPEVSVIIPVYNAEKYLRQCLDSVVDQTLRDIEIICVDDGSTDSSLEILQEYAQKDSRVKVLRQQNQYAGVARNNGMMAAAGEYYIFLDADDWFEADMLEEAYRTAKATSADVVLWSGDYFNDETGKVTSAPWLLNLSELPRNQEVFSWRDLPNQFFYVASPAPWNKLFKKEHVLKFDLKFQGFPCSNDLYFTYSALALAERISAVEKEFVHYRTGNPSSLQGTKRRCPDAFLKALLALKKRLVEFEIFEPLEQAFINMALDNCAYNLRTLHDRAAYEQLCLLLNCRGFDDLGISRKPQEYFYNAGNFNECKKAVDTLSGVSVIIPAYNAGKYISQCLESVLNQSLSTVEIICINDGSSDNTGEILDNYKNEYLNLHVIALSENQGSSKARQFGIESAHGKYIMFLDADDEYTEDACEKAYNAALGFNTDILQFGVKILPESDAPAQSVRWLENFMKPYCKKLYHQEIFRACFEDSRFSFNITNKIFKTELCRLAIQYLPESRLVIAEDLFLFFVIAYFANAYFSIRDKLYVYHYGRGGMGKRQVSTDEVSRHCEQVLVGNLCRDFLEKQGESYPDAVLKVYKSLLGECINVWRKLDSQEEKVSAAEVMCCAWQETPVFDLLRTTLRTECPEYTVQVQSSVKESDAVVPAGFEQIIPVIFATNDDYSVYAGVAIESILKHATPSNYYRIYVLHDDLSGWHIEALENIESCQATVKCVNIKNLILGKQSLLYEKDHFTKEMYYRFVIAELFPFYEKAIYLDCDLIAATDIASIIPEELGDYLIAAVRNFALPTRRKQISDNLGIDAVDYANSGVLVINIAQWNEEHITEKCFDLLQTIACQKLVYPDQDILNVVCNGRIFYLDESWNFYWHMVYGAKDFVKLCEPVVNRIGSQFKILHFASNIKPWARPELPLSKYFWEYARMSPFYEEILMCNMKWKEQSFTKSKTEVQQQRVLTDDVQNTNLTIRVRQLEMQLEFANQEIDNIHRSASYRIGRFVTFIPRKIRGGIRCYREHGWSYTWERVLVHLRVKEDPYR